VAEERILVVDDEPGVRSALKAILDDEGFQVSCAESGEQGVAAREKQPFDAVLLVVWLPGMDGLETLTVLGERHVDAEVVMISGHGTIETAVRATKLGAFDFVEKPLSLERTLVVLRNALRQRKLEQTNRQLMAQLVRDTEIHGHGSAVERLRREVEVAVRSAEPVLIQGRPGSGRENVARRIHTAGAHVEAPFVEIPCGALDTAAAELALFGDADRPHGRLRLAAGGSLFLEDVDRLAPEVQRRLAEKISTLATSVPAVRVTASVDADPVDLEPALRQVLEVIRIRVPSLVDRREDIPLLAERFMRDLSREYGRPARRLAPECLSAMKAHEWPGEMRELRNLIERLLLVDDGGDVQVEDLPEAMGGALAVFEDLYREFDSLDEGVKAFQRYYVDRIVHEESGDTAAAAKRLGMAKATLEKRLRNKAK